MLFIHKHTNAEFISIIYIKNIGPYSQTTPAKINAILKAWLNIHVVLILAEHR